MRRAFVLSWICVFIFIHISGMGVCATIPVPETVKKTLAKQGVSKTSLQSYFRRPFDHVALDVVLKNVTHKEVKAQYERFLSKKSIKETKKYLLEHRKIFRKVEKTYHVPKEIVVSILMVESSFGKHNGRYLVFSVYTSLASLNDKKIKKRIVKEAARAGEDVHAKRFKRRLQRKAKWGLKELLCLIRLSDQGKIDPFRLKGSWAGAFGMPQFIPTSFEAYGVDGDGDGVVNLGTLPDAAASAANYLKQHGWKRKMAHKRALRVIKFYNISDPYAETILALSKKLKK